MSVIYPEQDESQTLYRDTIKSTGLIVVILPLSILSIFEKKEKKIMIKDNIKS